MSPIVKETEVSSAAPATTAVRPPVTSSRGEDTAGRPQPVALEVPVTVNGARTVEGSDKREPFSENTKTVLVFGNGAVIRLTSSVASGQLLFLTNDKTKKEVVCQVVKSKNYRNVSGYVELEFTEPVVGFWGMRFPNDRIGPPSPAPAPVAAAPAVVPQPAPKTVVPVVTVAPKIVESKPAPIALVVPLPVLPKPEAARLIPVAVVEPTVTEVAQPVVAKSVESVPTVTAEPAIEEFAVSPEPPAEVVAPSAATQDEIPLQPVAAMTPAPVFPDSPKMDFTVVEPAKLLNSLASVLDLPRASDLQPVMPAVVPALLPAIVAPEQPALAIPVALPAASLPSISEVKPAASVDGKKESSPSADPTMQELKLETARLQEQLASLLFSGPQPGVTEQPAPSAPVKVSPVVSDAAAKLLDLAQAPPSAVKENKLPAPPRPALKSSLDVEEVKIPAWLEPLARNSAASSASHEASSKPSFSHEAKHVEEAQPFEEQSVDADSADDSASPRVSEAPMFGSQFSHEGNQSGSESASRGSKKGVWIGIAAGVLLLAGGATWYMRPSANSASGTVAAASPVAGSSFAPEVPANSSPAQTVPPASVSSAAPAASAPVANAQPLVTSHDVVAKPQVNTNAPAGAVHAAQPAPPQPKKTALGDVRLAAPLVNRNGAAQDAGEPEPVIPGTQVAANDDAMGASFAVSSGRQPAAPAVPLPMGGDVKSAKLLSSIPPVYPTLARTQHVSGDVKIDALIDENGRVTAMKILSGPALLHQSAMDSLRRWKYQPATLDGKPVSMHLAVTLQFRLQ